MISVKDIRNAVSSSPTAKSEKRVATQQHRQLHAKVDSIINLALESKVNANPAYKPHTNRLPITPKAACEAFAALMKINYPATSPRVTDLSYASDYPSSGFDDFREFTRKITKIAQVKDQYADMVEAKPNHNDKQTQLDTYGFQQQSNSEGSPIPPYELSYQRLRLDPNFPLHESNGRPYKIPLIHADKAAKLALVKSGVLQYRPWPVQALFWLIGIEGSQWGAGLLADDTGLNTTISAIRYILLTPWDDSKHASPIQGILTCPTPFYICSSLDIKGLLFWTSKSTCLLTQPLDVRTRTSFWLGS